MARPPASEALQAQHQLLSARISSATSYDDVTEAVASANMGWPAPRVVVVTILEPDGAHLLVGAHGMEPHMRSQWRRMPPHVDLPIPAAVRNREVLLLTDAAAVRRHFPAVAGPPYASAAVFAAPLLAGDRAIGALGLAWPEPIELSDDARRYLAALAEPVARKVHELRTAIPADMPPAEDQVPRAAGEAWLPIVLETVTDPAALLAPVLVDNQVADFRVEYANAAARTLIGPGDRLPADTTLLTMYPQVGARVLLPELTRVLADAQPTQIGPVRMSPAPAGTQPRTGPAAQVLTVRAAGLWDRVLMVWRVLGEAELIYPQLLEAERIARIGSFSWDLRTNEPQCSPQLYRLYFGDQPPGPIPVEELTECVHDGDLLAVQDSVRRMLVGGKQLSFEFRGAGRLAGLRIRVTAEPVTDADGNVTMVRGTVVDVTEERAMEARLRLAEEALAAQRRRLEAELRAAQALQSALLPTEPELGRTEGLTVHGRCRASDKTGRVDGDWYDACTLPGSATLLAVGDVAGSGLAAMTAAARLRYAVRAYAALGMTPGKILDAVNAMLCSLEPERTATLCVATYEPATRELRWAVAGGAAPARYRPDGAADLLTGPTDLPVGAAPDGGYREATVVLTPGDRVLLYTDGLIGAPGADPAEAQRVLLAATAQVDADDLEGLVRHLGQQLHAGPDEDMCTMVVHVTG
jgi:PAS domain-containing protein